jgi:hypothetical protein
MPFEQEAEVLQSSLHRRGFLKTSGSCISNCPFPREQDASTHDSHFLLSRP